MALLKHTIVKRKMACRRLFATKSWIIRCRPASSTIMEKGYYHVYSFGEDTPKLLTAEREFIVAMNILAYCSTIFKCRILVFIFMNSHFHLVLYGTEEECLAFGNKLMKMILHRINRNREQAYDFRDIAISADLIEDKEALMSIIAYDLRNSIEAGFRLDPRFYRWSSAALYFAPEAADGKRLDQMSVRMRRSVLGINYDLPGGWTVDSDGIILPKHYVDYKEVESIFVSIKAYIAFMYMKKDRILELNKQCLKVNFQALSDMELAGVADAMAKRMTGRRLANMDVVSWISLAQKLKTSRGTGVNQLARVLELNPEMLRTLLA